MTYKSGKVRVGYFMKAELLEFVDQLSKDTGSNRTSILNDLVELFFVISTSKHYELDQRPMHYLLNRVLDDVGIKGIRFSPDLERISLDDEDDVEVTE